MRKLYGLLGLISFFFSCSMDKPVRPPDNPDQASQTAITGMAKAVVGLRYAEQLERIRGPFQREMVETLSLALTQMPLNITRADLHDSMLALPARAFAKASRNKVQTQLAAVAALPITGSQQSGDSLGATTVGGFDVVIRKIGSSRAVAPVDSGIDSLFFDGSKLHHVHSVLHAGNRAIDEVETDADGDGYLSASSSTGRRRTLLVRSWSMGDTFNVAQSDIDYDLVGNGNPAWTHYREFVIVGGDTVQSRFVRGEEGYIQMDEGEDILDSIVQVTPAGRSIETGKRQLGTSGRINDLSGDSYIKFARWFSNDAESSYTTWADADNDGYMWDPEQSDSNRVWAVSRPWPRTGTIKFRRDSSLVALAAPDSPARQRICWQQVYDSLRYAIRIRQLRYNSNGAQWSGDTIMVDEGTLYNNPTQTASIEFGRLSESILEYRLIVDPTDGSQRTNYVRQQYALSDSSNVQFVVYEVTLPEPINIAPFHPQNGLLSTILKYRKPNKAGLFQKYDDIQFDLRRPTVNNLIYDWSRVAMDTSGDSTVQTFQLSPQGRGTFTESRSDSVRESMVFDEDVGTFGDTIRVGGAITEALTGTFNASLSRIAWDESGASVLFENGRLEVLGSSVADTLILAPSGGGLGWLADVDDYRFSYAYIPTVDGSILLQIQARDAENRLKIDNKPNYPMYIRMGGRGTQDIRVANPNRDVDMEDGDFVDYTLRVDLRRNSSFSGTNLF